MPDDHDISNHDISNSSVDSSGVLITNQTATDASGNKISTTVLTTLDPSANLQVSETLQNIISTYNDETHDLNKDILQQIKDYAGQIQCSKFHGNGTIDDYTELFTAASQIANESKQMQLNVDVEGFNEFAVAADQLSNLFTGFIIKIQKVNIINDTLFLKSILDALKKIVNLSNTFGKFKEAIIATSLIQIPQSCHDTSVVLQDVMSEINCAMDCINYFVNPTEDDVPDGALLNNTERQVINTAVRTINQWNTLCESGVNIALSNNDDIKNITAINNTLKLKTSGLNNAISILSARFKSMNI
jgi:hypothetical protein